MRVNADAADAIIFEVEPPGTSVFVMVDHVKVSAARRRRSVLMDVTIKPAWKGWTWDGMI